MYSDLPIWASVAFIAGGLAALAWSSDRFVAGAAALSRLLGVSQFVIGMVVVGFGTSAPELLVSTFSGLSGHSNLSLGNAYGSCIFNIVGILGVAALIRPVRVKRRIAAAASVLLAALAGLSWYLLGDGALSRLDALFLLAVFAIVMPVYCRFGEKAEDGEAVEGGSISSAIFWTLAGLGVMVGASHILVWGAVDVARALGVDELMIGLTIVAIGTSIPELASAIAASRRDEADLVLGNIVGSNIFNTLAVVGIACAITPTNSFSPSVMSRDLPLLIAVSLSIALFGLNFRKPREDGCISRCEGAVWIAVFAIYMAFTVMAEL